jgi:ectoine hydroxylase-related dioxygenase (phytanoyl-CoA dioxygenase family)
MGLIQRSESCRLVCHLYRDDPTRETREVQLAYGPGSLVIFNGDKLWHAVTPLARGEERVVLTMEYVTNPEMGTVKRFVSNMKDAIAYFGPGALVRRAPRPTGDARRQREP